MVARSLSPSETAPSSGTPGRSRAGFTLVEVIIAITILAFGLLGMAGTTALVVRQITLADVATERTAALQSTIERLRALPYDSVASGTGTVGIFTVTWRVTTAGQTKALKIITLGPGMARGAGGFPMMSRSVPDTFNYWIIRP